MHHTAQATNHEHEYEANGKKHGCFELDGTTPHGCYPVKHFDARRYGNDYGSDSEDGVGDGSHPNGEHVVGPNGPTHESDSYAREDHYGITIEWFA